MYVTALMLFFAFNKILCLLNGSYIKPIDIANNKLQINEVNSLADNYLVTVTKSADTKGATEIKNVYEISQSFVSVGDKGNATTLPMEYINSTEINRLSKLAVKDNKRMFVRLNMRQGLIMNQVLGVYALDDVNGSLCRNHSLEFRDALRAFEPWALKMFDSSSKLQSGILVGNLMEFGSFKQCVHIYAESQYGPIRGQQCTIKITPTMNIIEKILSFRGVSSKRFKKVRPVIKGASLYWSVCIPDSCTTDDVLYHYKKHIKNMAEGLDLNVTLKNMDCYALRDEPRLTPQSYFTLTICCTLFAMIVVCTIIDIKNRQQNAKNGNITTIFSAYSSAEYIFSTSSEDEFGLACLHGMRFLSVFYVVFGHRFLLTLFVPQVNALEVLDWLLNYTSTIIIGGTVSVDTFFMLSGVLVTYYTMNHLTKTHGKMNWVLFYLHRYVRITPGFAFVVLIHATVLQHFGSGPLWKKTVATLQKPCQYFWWSALLHIQNYVNPKYIAWYLTTDMQFYMFSPVVIYPLWKWRRFGRIWFSLIYFASVAVSFYLAWVNEYEGAMMVTNTLMHSKYFTQHYIKPYARASTYVMGIGLGALLYQTRHLKIKMNPVTVTVGWLWSSILLITTILGNHPFQLEDHDYNRLEASIFISMSRSAWTLGVMWIVWACKHGYGGPVNSFLSHPIFQVLGRISYSIFLWHMTIQYLSNGVLKLPIYFSDFSAIYTSFGDMCFTMIISIIFTICVECPATKLSRSFLKLTKN